MTLNLINWKSKNKKRSENGTLTLRFTKVQISPYKTQDSFSKITNKKTNQNTHTSNKKSTRRSTTRTRVSSTQNRNS